MPKCLICDRLSRKSSSTGATQVQLNPSAPHTHIHEPCRTLNPNRRSLARSNPNSLNSGESQVCILKPWRATKVMSPARGPTQPSLWNPDCRIMAAESWLSNPRCGILQVESWLPTLGCGIMAVESWLWNPGCGFCLWNPGFGILAVEPWMWNPGCPELAHI